MTVARFAFAQRSSKAHAEEGTGPGTPRRTEHVRHADELPHPGRLQPRAVLPVVEHRRQLAAEDELVEERRAAELGSTSFPRSSPSTRRP